MSLTAPNPTYFHLAADVSHTASKCILIWTMHSNRSAEGVSLLTQMLYVLVFVSRYLNLFFDNPLRNWLAVWNTVLKVFYIASSGYIVFLMMRVFARTREKEYGWKLATWSLGGALLAAPLVTWLFEGWDYFTVSEVLWTFSIILEAFCILPQLLLLRQTSVPTVLNSYYLLALGIYRGFYVLNWLVLLFRGTRKVDLPTSMLFGVIQTAFYIDFAWVYYSRQRVKLRGGGLVDSDDLRKSFLVNRFIGRRRRAAEEDEASVEDADLADQENGVVRPPAGRSWGARGISVSADDTLHRHDQVGAQDAQMMDPSHFEDDEEEEDDEAPEPPAKDTPRSGVESSAAEWQDDGQSRG